MPESPLPIETIYEFLRASFASVMLGGLIVCLFIEVRRNSEIYAKQIQDGIDEVRRAVQERERLSAVLDLDPIEEDVSLWQDEETVEQDEDYTLDLRLRRLNGGCIIEMVDNNGAVIMQSVQAVPAEYAVLMLNSIASFTSGSEFERADDVDETAQ